MIEALPSNLLMNVFEFLNLKDYGSLTMTCKRFSHIILNHNKFWIRECLTKYMSFDLQLYSETYDSEDYKSCVQARISQPSKNSWKQLLEELENQTNSFRSIFSPLHLKEEVNEFIEDLCATLKEPNLPMVNLKRETIQCSTQTIFQSKLSEVLYEDNENRRKLNQFNMKNSLIDDLKNSEKRIFQEMLLYDKNEILKARWYNFNSNSKETTYRNPQDYVKLNRDMDETLCLDDKSDMLIESLGFPDLTKISNTSTEDFQTIRNRNNLLLNIYDNLCGVLINYCSIIHRYLTSLGDVYLLLSEYTARWRVFVCSMLEIEKTFATFTELMNNNYDTIFEGYPGFPKFSVWRLMVKIWMREVYEKEYLQCNLNESFLQALSSFREVNIKRSFQNNCSKFNLNDEKAHNLPKNLYVSLKIKEKEQSSFCQTNNESATNTQKLFKSSIEMEENLLNSFLQSILDISFNEVNIHYLDCVDVPTCYPYFSLEESILQQTNEFYAEYGLIFKSNPDYFCNVLRSDSLAMSNILIAKTNAKLDQIQETFGLQVMKEFIHNKLDDIDEEMLQKCEISLLSNSERESELEGYVTEFVEKIISEKSTYQNCSDEMEICFEKPVEFVEDDGLVQNKTENNERMLGYIRTTIVALTFILPTFKTDLSYLRDICDRLCSKKASSDCIKQTNINNNIPCEMGDVDSLFYDFEKNVEKSLLTKLYDDYLFFQKQQQEEEELPYMSPISNYNNVEGDNENFGNNFGLPDDIDNLDLMSLGELTLRRGTII